MACKSWFLVFPAPSLRFAPFLFNGNLAFVSGKLRERLKGSAPEPPELRSRGAELQSCKHTRSMSLSLRRCRPNSSINRRLRHRKLLRNLRNRLALLLEPGEFAARSGAGGKPHWNIGWT